MMSSVTGPVTLSSSRTPFSPLSRVSRPTGLVSNTTGAGTVHNACTEPRAWQHDYALLLHEPVGKLCARNPVGERQPEIHRAFWRIAREPVLAECLHRGIAPLLEYGDVAGHPALPALERGDAGALHGHELARVEKALHSRERRDDLTIAARPATPPARHVV